MDQTPSVGRIVHYVSYGTPAGEYTSQCRAAIITEVGAWITVETTEPDSFSRSEGRPIRNAEQWFFDDALGLMVANPTGQFFRSDVRYDNGGETPGKPDCPNDHAAMPFRYCPEPGCGWQEASHKGGTWHWPERV